ncbi:MAG: hypothetical protein K0R39_4353 [Symbiobacteriaceae bacterium]|jgi:uncharacterized damage-inducible protein DinB|nr:hypothetical protein [Symbiobacteriaceae bacterium]
MGNEVAAAFVSDQQRKLRDIRRRMLDTLGQLSEADVNWRPGAESNSVANLAVHVCGNLTQRYVAQMGGAPDVRDRAAEFSLDVHRTVDQLQWMVDSTFDAVDEILAGFTPERLLETVQLRDRQEPLLHIITHTINHASEHLGQMLYIAKMRLGTAWKSV